MTAEEAFKELMNSDERFDYEHRANCEYVANWDNVPLNELPCDCYEWFFFMKGWYAKGGK